MSRMATGLRIYRRKLPHWRISGATYFVTWRLQPGTPDLRPEHREIVVSTLKMSEGRKYALHAFVVMNDHVHVLLTPNAEYPLERIVRAWKSYTSRFVRMRGQGSARLWMREYFDHIVRNPGEFREKAEYILNNPWKRWPDLEGYPWVGVASVPGQGGSGDPPPRLSRDA